MIDASRRHPATQQLARWLTANPKLPPGNPAYVAKVFEEVAKDMITALSDGPELSSGLRKLLEAKDCLVRAALETS